jgi:hypothetical protein
MAQKRIVSMLNYTLNITVLWSNALIQTKTDTSVQHNPTIF